MGRVADFFREQNIVVDGQKKTKMLSLDSKLEDMESERDSLKTENQQLKAQVNPLEREVERLKQRIEEKTAKPSAKEEDHLGDTELLVIKFIAEIELEDQHPAGIERVASVLKVNAIRAEVILTKLARKEFIYYSERASGYILAPKAKEYLVEKGVL